MIWIMGYRTIILLIAVGSCCVCNCYGQDRPVASTPSDQAIPNADDASPEKPAISASFEELKLAGARRSRYKNFGDVEAPSDKPTARTAEFEREIRPVLEESCVPCHGAQTQEGNIRIDTLDPNLLQGDDVDWWLEVVAVLSNGEMPPADEATLADQARGKLIEWLSTELQIASQVRRVERGHTSFRRMTAYEYNYALQDLLHLPYDFARDLPPEANSDEGFQNTSETLHMSAVQLETYRESSRRALELATIRGDRPAVSHWGVSFRQASDSLWKAQDEELAAIEQKHKDDPATRESELAKRTAELQRRQGVTHYLDFVTGRRARVEWNYGGAKYAWDPTTSRPEVPDDLDCAVILPPQRNLIIELGDTVPNEGTLRIRVRAARTSIDDPQFPSMQLEFGWQASNDSQASVLVSQSDIAVDSRPGEPKFYQWEIPLTEVHPRNSVRGISKMGDLPSPSEYIKVVNSSVSGGDIAIDYVEIAAPVYAHWPPESHRQVFVERATETDESARARTILADFLRRAWRRPVSADEIDKKVALFEQIRPVCDDFQQAMIEVLATSLASPNFLYLVQSDSKLEDPESSNHQQSNYELATRLAMFLWCSIPDDQLLDLASSGQLVREDVLTEQVARMLDDPRSRRFSERFVQQWLGMQLLDYLQIDTKAHPGFDRSLKAAMQEEPIAFFSEAMQQNHSILDLIQTDYAMVNERLARHYGIQDVYGNHFRKIALTDASLRGGLLTQAGLLAMNSDGKDSHPLKRGIWLLERILDDPPPPPPPAVPEIDLADPEIAKLTLKERIENHRDQAACRSCHSKIDPWGIAFEHFDAVGRWRDKVGDKPVDASSRLFNGQEIDGVDSLKRYLLLQRQDQFARAMVSKMTTYAIGRPLAFGDRLEIDRIAAQLRERGDGLATMVTLIVTSPLFR
jgi:mono/diheme cytochrome c family protein